MEGTNFRTFYQMKGFVNDQAKQALGIDSVQTLDMKWVTVGQNKRIVQGAVDETDVATFTVNSPGILKSLKVSLEPVQDLHGYDNPWPAGGGKNLFLTSFSDTTINDTTITRQADGKVVTSGVPSSAFNYSIGTATLPAGNYILNGAPSGGGYNKWFLQVTDTPVTQNYGQDSGSGISFTLEQEETVTIRIQLYTSADASMTFAPMIRLASETDDSYAPYANICPITGHSSVNVYHSGEDTTDYETVTVTFPEDPGTVYGGTLDLVTGVLTVDRASVDFGSLTWAYYSGSGMMQTIISDMKDAKNVEVLCTGYKWKSISGWSEVENGECATASGGVLRVLDANYTDATTFTTAMSGVKLVYPLATPETYQLTAQDIETLAGENNIWSDAGNVTVEYYDLEEVP